MAIVEVNPTRDRVDSQMAMKSDTSSVYGGILIDQPVSITEAVKLAGLEWNIDSKPVYVEGRQVEGYFGNVRSDNGETVGIVKGRYRPIQNSQAFNWLEEVTDGKPVVYSAGALKGGSWT